MTDQLPRRAARALRHAPDRLLHPLRRRRTEERLRQIATPATVVFICLGNINRSAFAAGLFEASLARRGIESIRVRSAGFIGPGRPSPEIAREAAGRRGIDLSMHESRLFGRGDVTPADVIVVMTPKQRRRILGILGRRDQEVVVLGDLDPQPIIRRAIQDPYGHAEDVFERVFDRIERCVEVFTRALLRQ